MTLFTHAQQRKQATTHCTRPTNRRSNSAAQVETQPLSTPTGTQERGLATRAQTSSLTMGCSQIAGWRRGSILAVEYL